MIHIKDLEFKYSDGREVFSGLDMSFKRGDRIGITGSNGAGKTTLFYIIMGLLKPSSGEVTIFNRTRKTEKDFLDVRQKIGLLFQDADDQLFCPTVEEDIAFGPLNLGKSHDEAKVIVSETCRILGLTGFEKKVTHRLSGGEKRLVALASVIAMNPESYLLDEPTSGLDKQTTSRLLQYLREYAHTYMIISHDRAFLEAAVDRIYKLENGKIIPEQDQ